MGASDSQVNSRLLRGAGGGAAFAAWHTLRYMGRRLGHWMLLIMNASTTSLVQTRLGPFAVMAILATCPAAQAQSYTAVNLGTLGGSPCNAAGISSSGTVVGDCHTSSNADHAFSYSNGVMTDLGTLGGSSSVANAVNGSGTVVGSSVTSGGNTHAFSYSGGKMTDLGTLGGNLSSIAYGINGSGTIVGQSITASFAFHAFSYSQGAMTDLGSFAGNSAATAINDSGTIVGWSYAVGGAQHAFSYSNGVMRDLGTLGGNDSQATAIDNSGTIAGWSDTAGGAQHAFSYSNGVMTDLGTLGGAYNYGSQGRGINDSGTIVGESWSNANQASLAFAFSNGQMANLNPLVKLNGDALVNAVGTNANGQIIAQSGAGKSYLLTPISQAPGVDNAPAMPLWALAVLGALLLVVGLRVLPDPALRRR